METWAGIGHNSGRALFTAPIVEIDPREAEWLAILESDDAFKAWAANHRENVYVRASVYVGRKIRSFQECGSWGCCYSSPAYWNGNYHPEEKRRPVVMMGARRTLIADACEPALFFGRPISSSAG